MHQMAGKGRSKAMEVRQHWYEAEVTFSTDYPTTADTFDTTLGGFDAFVTKLPTSSSALRVSVREQEGRQVSSRGPASRSAIGSWGLAQ
jgi:hypothetical protein